jgi:hypothetical protein
MYYSGTGAGGVTVALAPLPSKRELDDEARGWRVHAADVATAYDERLVNRRDVWGAYLPLERRREGSTYTAPGKALRGAVHLDARRLRRHVWAETHGHLVGVHSTSAEDTSSWGGFDLDAHGPVESSYRHALTLAAGTLAAQLHAAGAVPLVEDSNGAGGYHIWMYFNQPAPTAEVYAWLDALAERVRITLGVAVETYPKQASVRGKFGNWLRLPGCHHTKPHWSRVVRIGESWRSGKDAVRALLDWPATPVAVIPPLSAWPLRSVGVGVDETCDAPTERATHIRRYLGKLAHGHAGSGRSDRLFSLARFLRYGMRCTALEALGVMRAWNAGNIPPLPDAKVVTTWENSGTYNTQPYIRRSRARNAA